MTRRVVVTGIGQVTPLGIGAKPTWDALLAGVSGVRLLDHYTEHETPVRLGAPVTGEVTERLDSQERRRLDRAAQFALHAAREAWEDAGAPHVDPERLGVVVSGGMAGLLTLLGCYTAWEAKGARGLTALSIPTMMSNASAAVVAMELGARAGAHAPASACASGAESIAWAARMIQHGDADVVVCGGVEAMIHPMTLSGFAALRALSSRHHEPERASRPFDRDRDGFVLGEGGGMLVLESAGHAAARGAKPLAELAGAGLSSDAHHLVAPDPEGTGAAYAVTRALADAGCSPADVVHVNAHATATPLGDVAESVALRRALGDHTGRAPVTAIKSMLGHLIGAAGAVAAGVTVRTLASESIPATQNCDEVDDRITLDVVRGAPRPLPRHGDVALCTSFGFGGHNVVLAFRRAVA